MKPANEKKRNGSSCAEPRSLHHLYVEGELDGLRSARLLSHLEVCEPCKSRVAELQEERLWLTEVALKGPALSPRFGQKVGRKIRAEVARARWRRRLRVTRNGLQSAAVLLGAVAMVVLALSVALREAPEAKLPYGDPVVDAVPTGGPEASSLVQVGVAFPEAREPGEGGLATSELDCFRDESEDEGLDPLFPSTALVCANCADFTEPPERIVHRRRSPVFEQQGFRVFVSFSLGLLEDKPCPPDPNADGRSDGSDVAYVWQQLLSPSDLPEDLATYESIAMQTENGKIECEEDEACVDA